MEETIKNILITLGEIRGELVGIRKLAERVRKLELWQSWIKGAWAALVAGYAYLFREAWGK
jgi:hypothetical protein